MHDIKECNKLITTRRWVASFRLRPLYAWKRIPNYPMNSHNVINISKSGLFLRGDGRILNCICYSGKKENVLNAFCQKFYLSDLRIFFLQEGQVYWCTQLTRYISSLRVGCLVLKWCWIELLVLCSVCSLVCIECLVIWLDSLTRKLKVTGFFLVHVFTWMFSCFFLWCIVIMKFVKFQQ